MNLMRISKPKIVLDKEKRIYQVDVKYIEGNETLWYSVQDSFGDLFTDSSDAALVALIIPAMSKNEDIYIHGEISDRLYYNLSRPFQNLLRQIIPSLHQVGIYPENVRSCHGKSASGVATGFSGGVDSYCALADHYYSDIPERFKVTHLLFNNVGSHGADGERLFRKRFERLAPSAERIGLPLLMINSNLDLFYDKNLGFQKTHTMRNASVALLLQGGIGRYMYASTYKYSDMFIGSTYDTAYSDLVTLPLLSTDTLDAFSVGSEYSRVQKTLRVAELPDSYGTLDVCVNDSLSSYVNCSKCWKCLRTLATLEIAGYLDRYSDSFDLNIYKSQRKAYFATLLGSHDPLLREIEELADERNYAFPISSRLLHYSRFLPIMSFSKRGLRKLKGLARRFA